MPEDNPDGKVAWLQVSQAVTIDELDSIQQHLDNLEVDVDIVVTGEQADLLDRTEVIDHLETTIEALRGDDDE